MNKLFIFVLGATAGSLVTWKIVKEKYERIADEEIESVIEHFRTSNYYNKKKEESADDIDNVDYVEENDIEAEMEARRKDNENLIKELGYNTESVDTIEPYVISPEEYGEIGNDEKSWTLYSDGVITNEVGDIVSEPETIIGDALEHFGEYEDDSVHVRNENIEADIEIIKHEKSFSEINKEDD